MAYPEHVSHRCGRCGDPQMAGGAQIKLDWATNWDGAAPPAPDVEVDQRISW